MPFQPGQLVSLRADTTLSGAVIGVEPAADPQMTRYQVLVGDTIRSYYEAQLVPKELQRAAGLMPLPEFQARLTAQALRDPNAASLFSLEAARVDFIPYQFLPVMKMIRADRPRLLIADDVGVGKTIEAGLILRELQARSNLNSVLIICPRPLVVERKWEMEMKRFDEEFDVLDGPRLRQCLSDLDLNGTWPALRRRCILSFSLFNEDLLRGTKGRPGLLDLDPPPQFDLVIVDEAHHLRNEDTFVHQGVRHFVDNTEAVVFLTATPIQLGDQDLYVLLNMLRPDVVIDRDSFRGMTEPNPFLHAAVDKARTGDDGWNRAALEDLVSAGKTMWGRSVLQNDPDYQRLCVHVASARSPEERVAFIRQVEDLNPLARFINRTRRRDIGNFTTRSPQTVEVEFTPEQKQVHDAVLDIRAAMLARTHGDAGTRFMMTTLQRQVASCVFGLAPLVRQLLNGEMGDLEMDEIEEVPDLGANQLAALRKEIQAILLRVEKLQEDDPKLEALGRILYGKQELPNNKVLLFSTFRHTLSYLVQRLRPAGFRLGLIHGGVPDDERRTLRDRFSRPREDPNALDILLSSEVGCEGLDYQFCDCLVNYDLPWNPMRIEQRIGRIDRYGQKSEKIAIYNLVTAGTLDAEIYHRCLSRIGVFRQALGGNEEILGSLTQQLHEVAESLQLTSEEREQRLLQLADNEVRTLQLQDQLEHEQAALFGLTLPTGQLEAEIRHNANPWLSPAFLENLVKNYFCSVFEDSTFEFGDGPIKHLNLAQTKRQKLHADFARQPQGTSTQARRWEGWLQGDTPRVEVTFDPACAEENPSVVFVTAVHPLARQAASALSEGITPFRVSLQVAAEANLPVGQYPFMIYHWQFRGLRDETRLQVVCEDKAIQEQLTAFLQHPKAKDGPGAASDEQHLFDNLNAAHYVQWQDALTEHQTQTRQRAAYRRESLKASHRGRILALDHQLSLATNDNIRRMRQAQKENAQGDYESRLSHIQEIADIDAQPLAQGILHIVAS